MDNPFVTEYLREKELREIGFKSVGKNVRVAKNCTIVGMDEIEIGDNVRIDPYCCLIASDGWIRIGSHIHIAAYCFLSAGDGIEMDDFSGISQGVKIYSRTDDYTGMALTNPTLPRKYTNILGGTVSLSRHVIVGSGSVILPAVTIGEGSSVGALSLVTKTLDPWGVYSGIPAKRIKERSKQMLEFENMFLQELGAITGPTEKNQREEHT